MRLENGAPDDVSRRQGVVVYVVGALLFTFIVIAASAVFSPIDGEATFRDWLIRDWLITQPESPCACVFSQ